MHVCVHPFNLLWWVLFKIVSAARFRGPPPPPLGATPLFLSDRFLAPQPFRVFYFSPVPRERASTISIVKYKLGLEGTVKKEDT